MRGNRCRVNMAHTRQSRPDSGIDLSRFYCEGHPLSPLSATEREGDTFKHFQDFRSVNDQSQGQNLALTVLYVPYCLDSGYRSWLINPSTETPSTPV